MRYPNGGGVSYYESKSSRQRQLGEAEASPTLPEWDKDSKAYDKREQPVNLEMICGGIT